MSGVEMKRVPFPFPHIGHVPLAKELKKNQRIQRTQRTGTLARYIHIYTIHVHMAYA